jgi:hypothetical protein
MIFLVGAVKLATTILALDQEKSEVAGGGHEDPENYFVG